MSCELLPNSNQEHFTIDVRGINFILLFYDLPNLIPEKFRRFTNS